MADKAGHSSADYSGVVETAQIAVTCERAKRHFAYIIAHKID
ncbi:hypothetical protein MY5147_006262 [Beauveria neobassiana]